MKIEQPLNVSVDGADYAVSSFNETTQRLVAIHTAWRQDLANERLQLAKTEAALRGVEAELSQAVAAELEQRKKAQAELAQTPAVEPNPAVE